MSNNSSRPLSAIPLPDGMAALCQAFIAEQNQFCAGRDTDTHQTEAQLAAASAFLRHP